MTLETFFADSPLILATLAQSPRDDDAAPALARDPEPLLLGGAEAERELELA